MFGETYIIVLILSFLSGITTLIGVGLAFYFKKSVKGITAGIGFSAGIMIWISLLELLPEAVAVAGTLTALAAAALGFLLIFSLDFILPHTHIIEEKGKLGMLMKTAFLVSIGMLLHDFPEGFAMANSFVLAPALGLLVAVAIAIHNIPEEFAIAAPLILVKKRAFLVKLALLSALAEPLGAVFGLLAVSVAPVLNPVFLAFAAGAMIFVSIHELFPMAKRYKKTNWFVLGVVLSLLAYFGLAMFF